MNHDGPILQAQIGSKQNVDVVVEKFRKRNMLANGQYTGSEDHDNESKTAEAHKRLLNQIKTTATPFQRPILNFHTPTQIHIRASLNQISDFVRLSLSSARSRTSNEQE